MGGEGETHKDIETGIQKDRQTETYRLRRTRRRSGDEEGRDEDSEKQAQGEADPLTDNKHTALSKLPPPSVAPAPQGRPLTPEDYSGLGHIDNFRSTLGLRMRPFLKTTDLTPASFSQVKTSS